MAALSVVSRLTIIARVPRIYSPYSFSIVIPYFCGGLLVACMVAPLAFLLWSLHLLGVNATVPKRTLVLFPLLVIASGLWLAASWRYGFRYQGKVHTLTLYAINVTLVAILVGLIIRAVRRPSYASNYAFHWLMFAWVAWGAFPWLGELI
jgi:hypothetical protein